MLIPFCVLCKREKVEGIVCHHCDNAYCYDCLDIHPAEVRICQTCGQFICDECFEGMVECELKKNDQQA